MNIFNQSIFVPAKMSATYRFNIVSYIAGEALRDPNSGYEED